MRITGSVCKLCRREGEKLYLKGAKCFSPKCPVSRRAYPPGVHGPINKYPRPTEFGKQLREKQKAKRIFGANEEHFRRYYEKALTMKDVTADAILKMLEKRIDNVLYRAGFASSRPQARQFVSHGLVFVNGKRTHTPSMQMKQGDTFEVAEKAKAYKIMGEAQERKVTAPKWLKVDPKNLSGEVILEPDKDDTEKGIAASYIVEYYSK